MVWLILGVVLWSVVHLYPSIAVSHRNQLSEKFGNAYQGIFALTIVASIVLMVLGWKNTIPTAVYNPPAWGRHATMLLILIALVLFGAANTKTKIREWIRHPMLMGMVVWSIGHLLANGDIRSVILFGGLGVWAIISQFTINKREGARVIPTDSKGLKSLVILLVVSVVLYVILMFLHPYFAGVPVMTRS